VEKEGSWFMASSGKNHEETLSEKETKAVRVRWHKSNGRVLA
jgi:hypothetical protein